MRGAVGPVIVQMAAGEVHEPVHHAIAHKARRDAGGVVHRHGLVAVGLANALHLACDGVDSLVPADLLELARSALADALHGIVQAIGALKPPTDGTPPQAGAQLGLVHCGIARVIGFHIRYLLVAHMALQRAGAAAIDRAMRPNDSVLGRSPFGFPLGLRSRRTAEHGRASRTVPSPSRTSGAIRRFHMPSPPCSPFFGRSLSAMRRAVRPSAFGRTSARHARPNLFPFGLRHWRKPYPAACAPCHIKCMNFTNRLFRTYQSSD